MQSCALSNSCPLLAIPHLVEEANGDEPKKIPAVTGEAFSALCFTTYLASIWHASSMCIVREATSSVCAFARFGLFFFQEQLCERHRRCILCCNEASLGDSHGVSTAIYVTIYKGKKWRPPPVYYGT